MRAKLPLRLLSLIAALPVLLAGCGAQPETDPQAYTAGLSAMGTYMNFTAYGDGADAALSAASEHVTQLESLWSTTDAGSEIYAVNHSGGQPVQLSAETAELLRFTLEMARQTGGALDPTIYPLVNAWGFITREYRVPSEEEIRELLPLIGYERVDLADRTVTLPQGMQLDLGAVGKGYTGDLLAGLLREQGVTSALLDIGGNIQLVGGRPDGAKWRLGIRNPFGEGSYGILEAEDCAVVTSGGYERYFTAGDGTTYGHILDPATGYPAESGLASVTIVAPQGRVGDALSTAIFVMGLDAGAEYWRTHGGFDMLLMTQDGQIYLTKGIEADFTPADDFSGREIHVITQAE